ncbi:MAG: 4Fe-4S binding protein [Clostridiales Family XIII bacterium]|jgi:epoxyqueuosine reductase QueG|nr:4Fe-4S binding protein [Clostridiales Family XIII bacterium]
MTAADIESILGEWMKNAPENLVAAERALEPGLAGLRIYDDPIACACAADDACLLSLADNDAANVHLMMPEEWLPGARSVVSFFFPLSEEIRESNRKKDGIVSLAWLHGRIEGQACAEAATRFLAAEIGKAADVVIPTTDERYKVHVDRDAPPQRRYSPNWSERHVAYAAGLGTFSMPGGLITARGVAGRIGSIVTTAAIEPTPRPYEGVYDHCIRCGACARRCPAGAISEDMTKDNARCSAQLDIAREKYPAYYGCGKCQVAVPCESRIPKRREAPAHNASQ